MIYTDNIETLKNALAKIAELEKRINEIGLDWQANQVKLAIAIDALEYWKNECSGFEPSLSVFHLKVEEALNKLRSE